MTTNTTTVQQPVPAAATTILPTQEKATDKPIKPLSTNTYTPAVVKPSADALVENRIGGLLDPNNPLMRKAKAQAQGYSASRGLQSSSIGGEIALSSMIDKAQGIASQDANTFAQFEKDDADRTHSAGMQNNQQSWQSGENQLGRDHDVSQLNKQQTWQSGENQLGRTHETTMQEKQQTFQKEFEGLQQLNRLGMLDAEGKQRLKEMETNFGYQTKLSDQSFGHQMGLLNVQGQQRLNELDKQAQYQATENAASREFQATMQDLQYKQQQGILDIQGQQQLQQMERNSQLTTQRDSVLQQFQKELNTQQNQQRISEIDKELNARKDLLRTELDAKSYSEYNNAVSSGYNNLLGQMGAIYSNPNMTAAQQQAGVAKITEMFKAQQAQLETLYGLPSGGGSAGGSTGSAGQSPNQGPLPQPAGPQPAGPQPTSPINNKYPRAPGGGTDWGGGQYQPIMER